jgi:hypothetical protein
VVEEMGEWMDLRNGWMGGWVDGWMGVFKDCVDGWVAKVENGFG